VVQVDRAERLDGRLEVAVDVGLARDVGGDGDRAARQVRRGPFGRGAVDVDDHDVRPGGGEQAGRRRPDPAPRPGHHGDAAPKIDHAVLPAPTRGPSAGPAAAGRRPCQQEKSTARIAATKMLALSTNTTAVKSPVASRTMPVTCGPM